jgi:hypothetical protein
MSLGPIGTAALAGSLPDEELSSAAPIGLSNSDGETSLYDSTVQNLENIVGPMLPGSGVALAASNAGAKALMSGNSPTFERIVTFVLGFILIAAGLFSHPAVRETIVSTTKKAGKAAAIAA